jgi:hypothetical protein
MKLRISKQKVTGAAAVMLTATSLALPVQAQRSERLFQVPAGCSAFLTVQSRGCTVSHHWTCEGDPAGTHWRVALDEDGPFYLSFTDREFRWLRSWALRANIQSHLIEPEDDPASLTELFETGSDSMVFSLQFQGPEGVAQRDYTGFDRLTGGEVTVDGQTLLVTEFAYEYNTPDGLRRTEGSQFVHQNWRLFFGGMETTILPDGERVEENHAPMEFAGPGEDGFLTLQPNYDCGAMMSSLEAPLWRASQ